MTPEELNRAIEFLVQWQARMAARQEDMAAKHDEHEAWTKDIVSRLSQVSEENARLLTRQVEILNRQSERMDRIDRFYEHWLRQSDTVVDLQREALRLLKQILNRLPPYPPNPN